MKISLVLLMLFTNTMLKKIRLVFYLKAQTRVERVFFNQYIDIPDPRSDCAMVADSGNVYVFGGKNESKRYNDLWLFSLSDFKFKRLSD